MTFTVGAGAAAAVALFLTPLVLRVSPQRVMRVNVNGRPVPAVLGIPLVTGALVGVLAAGLMRSGTDASVLIATAVALGAMGAAGWWDDLRGDESDRGFRGHLSALGRLRVTGGVVKIAVGMTAGAGVALLVAEGAGDRVAVALSVPLGANLVNLLDRAPGRAGKFALVLIALSALAGPPGMAPALGGPAAALTVVLVWDLRERGMLGDTGANAIGAVAGLGAALALEGTGRWMLLALLLAANLASERWSFSNAIRRSPPLAWLDMLGRRRG